MVETKTLPSTPPGAMRDAPPFGIATLIALFLAVHVVTAWLMPLNVDESYAVAVSRQPSLAFFDHPLLAFSLARWSAEIFSSEAKIFVRLPYVLLGAATTWLLWSITRRLSSPRAALWAAAWFSIAPYFCIAANQFIGPDGPLGFFLLLTIWFAFPALFDDRPARPVLRWALAGTALGLAMLSKYHAAIFALAALIAMLALPRGRRALRTPGPWLAATIALFLQIPTFVWNSRHYWASFRFQAERADPHGHMTFDLLGLAGQQLGQMAFLWPVPWFMAVAAIVAAFRRGASEERRAFALIASVLILFFDLVSLSGSPSPPHWSMPGFLIAMPLVGILCEETAGRWRRFLRPLFWLGFGGTLLILGLATYHMRYGLPFTDRPAVARSEARWDTSDWSDLAPRMKERGAFVSGTEFAYGLSYQTAGKIAYALGPDVPVIAAPINPRHFEYLRPKAIPENATGYAFAPARLDNIDAQARQVGEYLKDRFGTVERLEPVIQRRGGKDSFAILVFRVSGPR
ncbi:MAG: hypothetical protein Kow0026_01730 [Oricola sp.]